MYFWSPYNCDVKKKHKGTALLYAQVKKTLYACRINMVALNATGCQPWILCRLLRWVIKLSELEEV